MEQVSKKLKTCAITGRRPDGFSWEYGDNEKTRRYKRNLFLALSYLVEVEGVQQFITGGALGVDLDAADVVLSLQQKAPTLGHLLVLPYEKQGDRYALKDKNRHNVIQKQSEVIILSDNYTPWCMQQRNEYMVDNADLVAAFVSGKKTGGTYNTIRYAQKTGKPVFFFDLDTCGKMPSEKWITSALPYTIKQLTIL